MLKFCKYCNAEFDINDENHWSKILDFRKIQGFYWQCKLHRRQKNNIRYQIQKKEGTLWYKQNIEKSRISKKLWKQNNLEKKFQSDQRYRESHRDACNLRNKKWREHNPKYMTQYDFKRIRKDSNYRLTKILRSRLNSIIQNKIKVGSAVKDLGCSVDFLRQYLESKFQPEMTWNNYGFGKDKWNIDHIKPLSKFDLTDREQFLKACHYTNLQPMWQLENIKKGNRI